MALLTLSRFALGSSVSRLTKQLVTVTRPVAVARVSTSNVQRESSTSGRSHSQNFSSTDVDGAGGTRSRFFVGGALLLGGIGLTAYTKFVNNSECATAKTTKSAGDSLSAAEKAGLPIKGLPEYSQEEVAKHKTPDKGIWMTYKNGVYDVTSFMKAHPGGGKIWLAAGGSLEPFWALYAVHKSDEVFEILEEYRIGNYQDADKIKHKDLSDPFANDPYRHPALRVNSEKPFNAEPPPSLLVDSFVTPNELFFVRNHLPVPQCDMQNFKLRVEVPGKKTINLSMDNLKKNFKEHTIMATMQCAGNRRSQMSGYKTVKGLSWRYGAISTAEWTGVKLRDLLLQAGLTEEDEAKFAHIQFEGLDKDASGGHYGSSIPFSVAMNPFRDVLVAYKMNGTDIPADHGCPLRVIIPGNIGARSVKWLYKIVASDQESPSHWQQNDYKSFNPSVDFGQLDYKTAPAIQEYPVQSAICTPRDGSKVDVDEEKVTIKGYAWSGGGRGILRVDVSVDGGKEWHVAELQDAGQKISRVWAWTLWEAEIPIPKDHGGKLDICCKAIDSSHNVQPDTMKGIWNVRGLLNTAWHRIHVGVVQEE
ncbi:sulfite oxidase-like [Patiria miniata]|uniref:Sulfite oxidase n=1 Tax=Patiria miniata TaxID=46514 RepID=A0A914B8B5_PATMI|nr:sulfite oxidase-like [Patiria miniata]